MKRVIVAPAALSGAPLAELKDWLAIRTDGEDALLQSRLRAALEMCESFTGTMPLTQSCEDILPAARGWLSLSARPVVSVAEVWLLEANGSRQLLDDDGHTVALDADGGARVQLRRDAPRQRLLVRYTAGLASEWERLEAGLRQGVIRLAAYHYNERGADASAAPPASVAALWQPWRRLRLR